MSTVIGARARDVLAAIAAHLDAHGSSPTIREIAAAIGITSTNGVSDHLAILASRGLVLRGGPRVARSLRLTAEGRAVLGGAVDGPCSLCGALPHGAVDQLRRELAAARERIRALEASPVLDGLDCEGGW